VHRQPARQRRDAQRRQQPLHARPQRGVVRGDEADAGAGGDQPAVGDLVVGAQRELLARPLADAAAPMAVAVSALSLWMLATGAWLMRRAR
jgi:hypothetical protein